MPLSIAIIGAGPAGCTLARLLSRSDLASTFSVTVFEAEATANTRSQGGTLDLHEKGGQEALRRCDLYDEFLKNARFDGEAMIIADRNLLRYINSGAAKKGSRTGRPEIDRPILRQMLVDSIPQSWVRWGSKVATAREDPKESGRWSLVMVDGSEHGPFDLIVGADGAWSKIRPLLSDKVPFYSGIAGSSYYVPDAQSTAPDAYNLVNRGSVFAMSDNKFFGAQFMGEGCLNVSLWRLEADEKALGRMKSGDEALAADKELVKDWHPRMRAILDHCDPSTYAPRPLYMLPLEHKWAHRKGLTLIGDAAHLMTPFAGEGVNAAMKDSVELADAIIAAAREGVDDNGEVLFRHHRAFEEELFVRGARIQAITNKMMTLALFTPNAPASMIEEYILTAVADGVPRWLYPLVYAGVYAYFGVFKLFRRK